MKVQGATPRHWSATYTLAVRLENAIVSYVRYIGKAFWPASLVVYYPHPGDSLKAWQIAGALVCLLAITALVLLAWRRRYLTVGWFWFLLTLVPMIGLVQVGNQAMADRYAYDSFWGLFIMVCWGVADYAREHQISARLAGASAAVLLTLTVVSSYQIGYWKDNLQLWLHATQFSENSWEAEDNLAIELATLGKPVKAMQHYRRAYAMNPDDAQSNLEIGFFEQNTGNPQNAIFHYQRALHANNFPSENAAALWRNMGVAYRDLGDTAKAREYFEKSASLNLK